MDTGLTISLIVAVADNAVIGRAGEIPWRLKADLRRFKELTTGHTLIVGRKTHESIVNRLGHPLANRRMIILSRQPNYLVEGCEVVRSWEEAIERAWGDGEVFVIGGAEVYKLAKPYAERVYLTEVHARPAGDAYFYFPEWYDTNILYEEESVEQHRQDAENEYDYTFRVLRRRKGTAATLPHHRQSYVNPAEARFKDQRVVMERIAQQGICPFCPEYRKAGEVLAPLWRGKHWVLVPNRWPYKFTTLHLMAIPARHVCFPHELGADEWGELREAIAWATTAHGLRGGAIGIRFGDPRMTGASVAHLHVQLIVADQNVDQPGYQRVRFPMGPKSPQSKEKNNPES